MLAWSVIPACPESFLLFEEGFPARFACGNDIRIIYDFLYMKYEGESIRLICCG